MKIESTDVGKKKKKIDGFIWGFLIGMALQLIIIGAAIIPFRNTIWWAIQHPAEMKWSMDRYTVIQQASKALYFESKMDGVTIVKPQSMN